MPTTYQADPARAVKTTAAPPRRTTTDTPDRSTTGQTTKGRPTNDRPTKGRPTNSRAIEAKPAKKYGRANPDFAAMAGWRAGFGSPYHKAHIVRALRNTSALCPQCSFDLINQRRPDCPECNTPIDPERIIVQSAPPRPLMIRSFIAAVALSWIAMIAGGFAWAGVFKALSLTGLFALQLACGWVLLTLYTDTTWYRGISTPNRKILLAGSITAAAVAAGAAALAIAGLL